MEAYYETLFGEVGCACKCGGWPNPGRRFITGHNLRMTVRTAEHCRRIAEGARLAWLTKRQRMPVGSTRHDNHGYVLVKTVPGQGRWEKQHGLVMEEAIGRPLNPGEQVHHINGVKDDNRIENLLLCPDNSDHMTVEASFRKLLPELMTTGLVIFDHAERRYRCA